jgi:hypothetical protein
MLVKFAGVGDRSGSRLLLRQKGQEDSMSDPNKDRMFY